MEPKFQTSFIPKKSVSSAPQVLPIKKPSNIFSSISTVLFVLVILLSCGLFFYKKILIKQIDTANISITETRGSFQEDTIKQIINYDNKISFATQILNKHVILYPLFVELENLTLKNISFSNFTYADINGVINISSNVLAKDYNALAQQSIVFSKSKYISNSTFSDFNLTETGNISAKFNLNINNALVSYKKNTEGANLNQ